MQNPMLLGYFVVLLGYNGIGAWRSGSAVRDHDPSATLPSGTAGTLDSPLCAVTGTPSLHNATSRQHNHRKIDLQYKRQMAAVLFGLKPLVNVTGILDAYEIFIEDVREEGTTEKIMPGTVEGYLNDMWKSRTESAQFSTSSVRLVVVDWVDNRWFSQSGSPLIAVVFAVTLNDTTRSTSGAMLPTIKPFSQVEIKDHFDRQSTISVYTGPIFHAYNLAFRFAFRQLPNSMNITAYIRDHLLDFLNSTACRDRDNATLTDHINIRFGNPYPAVVRDLLTSNIHRMHDRALVLPFVITVNTKVYQGPYPLGNFNADGFKEATLMSLQGDRYRIDPCTTLYRFRITKPEFDAPRYWPVTADHVQRVLQSRLDRNADPSAVSQITLTVSALSYHPILPEFSSGLPDGLMLSVHAQTSSPSAVFVINAALPVFEVIQKILSEYQLQKKINDKLSSMLSRKRLYNGYELTDILFFCGRTRFYDCENSNRSMALNLLPVGSGSSASTKGMCADVSKRQSIQNTVNEAFDTANSIAIDDFTLNATMTSCTDGLLTSKMVGTVRVEFAFTMSEPFRAWSVFEIPADAELDEAFAKRGLFRITSDPVIGAAGDQH